MFAYRIILYLLAPVVMFTLLLRRIRETESREEIAERFAIGAKSRVDNGRVVWVHGASLGEMTAAKPFMEDLITEIDGLKIIATVNTITAREMVIGWKNPAISVQLAPLDYAPILKRFIRIWQPLVSINLENEIWPIRILTCRKSGIPLLVLGGRISENAFRKWSKRKKMATKLFGAIDYLAPIDGKNSDRFLALGLTEQQLGKQINLKTAVRLDNPANETVEHLKKNFQRNQTYLSASTHKDDENLILTAFADALITNPDIKLILAPRHPSRGDEVAQLIETKSLTYSRRSAGQNPANSNSIYLVDTLGEMPLWYRLAKATIIGGTFSDIGGHTPVEPIQFNSIVVHGPDTANNADTFAALHRYNAAIAINGRADLQALFENNSPDLGQGEICKRAENAVHEMKKNKSDTGEFIETVRSLVSATN